MNRFMMLMILMVLSTSCLKTAEQRRREENMDNMSRQLSDSQNIVADLTVALKNLQAQIDQLNGQVDELKRGQQEIRGANLKGMSETLSQIKQETTNLSETQKAQTQELKDQRAFIEKVTEKLGKINAAPAPTAKKNSKEETIDELGEAKKLTSKKKFAEAQSVLEGLLASDISPGDTNKVYHALGENAFAQKDWEKSLVYFSKIYTKYPKSSLAPSSLLHIGKALDRLGKKDEAQAALDELKKQYPGSRAAKEAKL